MLVFKGRKIYVFFMEENFVFPDCNNFYQLLVSGSDTGTFPPLAADIGQRLKQSEYFFKVG